MPAHGQIYGLFLEAARWDNTAHALTDPKPKELFSTMPVLHLNPKQDRPYTLEGIYRCPVYKILTRTGMLSTTGHRYVDPRCHPLLQTSCRRSLVFF